MTTLDIAELALDVRAVTTPDRLGALERFVAHAVSTRIADALTALEDIAAAYPDDAEIFIDRLDVDCSFSASWDGADLARALAARVHEEIARATRSSACLVFRDRAEYLAALILALVDGQAGRHWWFDSFAGLALVPASNAVRTVVLDEGEAGIAALARLTTRDAQRIVGALSRGDAARILDRLATRTPAAAPSAALLWDRSRDLRELDDDPNGWLLALVAAERADRGSAGAPALALLQSFGSLRSVLRDAPSEIATALGEGRATVDLLEACGVDASGLRMLNARALGEVWEAVRKECATDTTARSARATANTDAGVVHFTPFGGALLLRVVLDRTEWRKDRDDDIADDALAWLIVTRAVAAAPDVRLDTALRVLLPADSAARADALCADEALGATVDAAAATLLREFARRLPGCADASPEWLRTQVLAFPARVTSTATTVEAIVGRPPLDVLLVLGGWKRTQCTLADGRLLTLREDAW